MPKVSQSGNSGKKGQPPKRQLSTIPDDDKPVVRYFTFILVGHNSKEFAEKVVDAASEYRNGKGSRAEDEDGEQVPGSAGGKTKEKDLVAFIPMPELGGQARLRFHSVASWSDSLPPTKGAGGPNSDTLVVFTYWRIPTEPKDEDKTSQDALSDMTSRMAEIQHISVYDRPFAQVCAFPGNEAQETEVMEFVQRYPKWLNWTIHKDGDEAEDLLDAIEEVCASMVRFVREAKTLRYQATQRITAAMGDGSSEKKCCTVS
eukprot:TRINITY_DN40215_c0_g1_i1.p1 TRINITY_DN40215_c0_g1~~TRINITY_DN40215_c0_g1_i1.p1  ORF type:complete len:259 (+),score=56.14 TRINITY_DN40215_c0_g1_i1:63-839(+)